MHTKCRMKSSAHMQNNDEVKGLDNESESSHTLLLIETAACDVETYRV